MSMCVCFSSEYSQACEYPKFNFNFFFTEHGQTRECRKCVFLLSMVRRVNAVSVCFY